MQDAGHTLSTFSARNVGFNIVNTRSAKICSSDGTAQGWPVCRRDECEHNILFCRLNSKIESIVGPFCQTDRITRISEGCLLLELDFTL